MILILCVQDVLMRQMILISARNKFGSYHSALGSQWYGTQHLKLINWCAISRLTQEAGWHVMLASTRELFCS